MCAALYKPKRKLTGLQVCEMWAMFLWNSSSFVVRVHIGSTSFLLCCCRHASCLIHPCFITAFHGYVYLRILSRLAFYESITCYLLHKQESNFMRYCIFISIALSIFLHWKQLKQLHTCKCIQLCTCSWQCSVTSLRQESQWSTLQGTSAGYIECQVPHVQDVAQLSSCRVSWLWYGSWPPHRLMDSTSLSTCWILSPILDRCVQPRVGRYHSVGILTSCQSSHFTNDVMFGVSDCCQKIPKGI